MTMPTHKELYLEYVKQYNKLMDLNPDKYDTEIVITFYDGHIHHRNFYTFYIDEERILDNAKILPSDKIIKITYVPYLKPVQNEGDIDSK